MTRSIVYWVRFLALVFVVFVAFWVGVLIGEGRGDKMHCDEQRKDLTALLASDPAFAGVLVEDSCDGGWVILTGRVGKPADLVRLRDHVTRVIGERRAEYAVSFVQVVK